VLSLNDEADRSDLFLIKEARDRSFLVRFNGFSLVCRQPSRAASAFRLPLLSSGHHTMPTRFDASEFLSGRSRQIL
jgi:hypothetical protein